MKLGKKKSVDESTTNSTPTTEPQLECVFSVEKEVYKEPWFDEFKPMLVKLNTVWNLEKDVLYTIMPFETFQEQFESEDDSVRDFLFSLLEPHCPLVVKFFNAIMKEAEPEKVIEESISQIKDPRYNEYYTRIDDWFTKQAVAAKK